MRVIQQVSTVFLSSWLVVVGVPDAFGQFSSPAPFQAAQQSPDQLQQLVAPIALYPDKLIAQILQASTFPSQIVEAKQSMDKHKEVTGEKLAKEVDKQHWDPSVKALTQFPAVLANMNQNLAWTSELGDVYVNQQQDLSNAIQTMRQRAKKAGNLNTTSQETVTNKGSTIVIEPAAPDVVYVPQYDPWLVYGDPLGIFPGWYPFPGLFLDGPGIEFGLGFGIGFWGGFGWGWNHWGFNWHGGGRVVFNHNTYVSHSNSIVNRNGFHSARGSVGHSGGFDGRSSSAAHSGAFSGFDHGGIARGNSFRGQSSFGGFHGGGFGGGGGFHGGGGRR